ncbi:MAG: DUF4097 family beta strand repeat-containing protein [Bacteroidota bacterium]
MINESYFWILIFILVFPSLNLWSQEQRLPFTQGKVIINGVGNLNVEGYDGNEVIIMEMLYELNRPDLSEGLKKMHSNKSDIEVEITHEIKGDELVIEAHGRAGRYHLKIPRQLDVAVKSHTGSYYYYDGLKNLNFKNIDGEIEVFADGSIDVNIEGAKGSMSIVTYGNITVDFAALSPTGVYAFDTYLGHVNVALPRATATSLQLRSKKGDIYSDLAIQMLRQDKKRKEIHAQTKGGGATLMINAEAGGDIYLRAKD